MPVPRGKFLECVRTRTHTHTHTHTHTDELLPSISSNFFRKKLQRERESERERERERGARRDLYGGAAGFQRRPIREGPAQRGATFVGCHVSPVCFGASARKLWRKISVCVSVTRETHTT